MARRADNPVGWLYTAVPKCFLGVLPVTAAGCPSMACISLKVTKTNRVGECVSCRLTREQAQQRAAATSDPALKALAAMKGGQF